MSSLRTLLYECCLFVQEMIWHSETSATNYHRMFVFSSRMTTQVSCAYSQAILVDDIDFEVLKSPEFVAAVGERPLPRRTLFGGVRPISRRSMPARRFRPKTVRPRATLASADQKATRWA